MQGLIVVGAWVFAVLLAAVVLGFAVYELTWKFRRLHSDQRKLEDVISTLNDTAADLQLAADRARRAASPRSAG
jgi:biopolymer transport protein ExbB/TolQ